MTKNEFPIWEIEITSVIFIFFSEVISISHIMVSYKAGFQKWPIFPTTIGYRLHEFDIFVMKIFKLQLQFKLHVINVVM